MKKEKKALRSAKSYPAFREKEKERKKTLFAITAGLALGLILYIVLGYFHLWLKDGVDPFTKEMKMVLYPSFFIALLITNTLQISGKQKRAKKFLQKEIATLESVLQNIDLESGQYEDLAYKITKLTDDKSVEGKESLKKFLLETNVSDCFIRIKTKSRLETDKDLYQVIGKSVELLQTEHSYLSKSRLQVKKYIQEGLKRAQEEITAEFKKLLAIRINNLRELV